MIQPCLSCLSLSLISRLLKLNIGQTPDALRKLADFNLACNFRKGQKLSSRCGSLMYLAPEVIHKSYTEARLS